MLSIMAGLVAGYAYQRSLGARFQDYLDSELAVEMKQAESDKLKKRIEEYRLRVNSLRSDDLEMEADIRRSKKFVREGESIYRIEPVPDALDSKPGGEVVE